MLNIIPYLHVLQENNSFHEALVEAEAKIEQLQQVCSSSSNTVMLMAYSLIQYHTIHGDQLL